MEQLLCPPARYRVEAAHFARKLTSMLADLVAGEKPSTLLLMPEFIKGQSTSTNGAA